MLWHCEMNSRGYKKGTVNTQMSHERMNLYTNLFKITSSNYSKTCVTHLPTFISGNYSCLVAEFHLHRSIGFHLIQSYLPSILIVCISWVSFWMDVDCVPARVTLGVITLLTVSSRVSGMTHKRNSSLLYW